MTDGHRSAFEAAADDTLAAMFFDPERIDRAEYEFNLRPVLFPSDLHRLTFQAMCDLRKKGEVIHDTTILAKVGGRVSHDWLADVLNRYAPAIGAAFEANCKLVHGYGMRAAALRAVLLAAAQFEDASGKSTGDIIRHTIDILGAAHTTGGIHGVTAGEAAISFSEYMNGDPIKSRSTGLIWLDNLTGGFSPADIWWIVSAYKMRKTTLMLNLMIQAALSGASVAFLSREMLTNRVSAQLVAMFAIGFLLENGLYDTVGNNNNPLNWISARSLMQARAEYRRWDNRKVAAIDYGINQYHLLRKSLRIYDTSDAGGRLSDIASAEAVVKRDKSLYGTDMVFVDYLGLFDAPGAGVFDKTAYASRTFQEIGKRDNLTMIIAAQKNEDSIRNGHVESYSPGVKGGGDPAATADFMMETQYKYGELMDERKLQLSMSLSRHGSGGNDTKTVVDIHPASGLILEGAYACERSRNYSA
jgi:replicative DNA helicase